MGDSLPVAIDLDPLMLVEAVMSDPAEPALSGENTDGPAFNVSLIGSATIQEASPASTVPMSSPKSAHGISVNDNSVETLPWSSPVVATPSLSDNPELILPHSVKILGAPSSLTRDMSSSIGTTTPLSAAIEHDSSWGSTPRDIPDTPGPSNLARFRVRLPHPARSSPSAVRTPKNSKRPPNPTPRRFSSTPFDRKVPLKAVSVMGDRKKQSLISSVLGIVPLSKNTDLNEEAATKESV